MGADDGLDVVVSKAGGVRGERNAVDGGEEEGNISAGVLKSEIDGTKGGISPLFFSSILWIYFSLGFVKPKHDTIMNRQCMQNYKIQYIAGISSKWSLATCYP